MSWRVLWSDILRLVWRDLVSRMTDSQAHSESSRTMAFRELDDGQWLTDILCMELVMVIDSGKSLVWPSLDLISRPRRSRLDRIAIPQL
jgi:hypothetical protein